jgi:hypothetical protein
MQQQPAFAAPIQLVPAPPPSVTEARLAKLRTLAAQYEIRPDSVSRLRQLEGFAIVMICDDSGSMATPVSEGGDPYAKRRSRWDELCSTASIVCELGTALTERGVDVHFLNRPPLLNVTSASQMNAAFSFAPPAGFTPLTRALQHVLSSYREALRERKLLIVIATDGQPTDDAGRTDIPSFLNTLRSTPATCFVQIMACTDDEESVAYLNEADRDIPRLDVTDDYRSERDEVRKHHGSKYAFSYGDYVVKALLGPVDPTFDQLDGGGPRPAGGGGGGGSGGEGGGCCVVA